MRGTLHIFSHYGITIASYPGIKKIFYPRSLSSFLNKTEDISQDYVVGVCKAFLNKTWFLQRWFFASLFSFANSSLISALRLAKDAGLLRGDLAQDNFSAVVVNQDPCGVVFCLEALNAAGLLGGNSAQANRIAVANHQAPNFVASAVCSLYRAGLLRPSVAQERFFLVAIRYAEILFHADTRALWSYIPSHYQFTEKIFNDIITICNNNFGNLVEARRLFAAYVNEQILAPINFRINLVDLVDLVGRGAARRGAAAEFNTAQSTHTASVHKTVSESASNLKKAYGEYIVGYNNLTKTLKEFGGWINTLSDAVPKHKAAKNCWNRLQNSDHFIDPSSNVSTKELLALVWCAFHDKSKLTGTIEDALNCLIEGLYEIQRGYNLDFNGVDRGGDDKPICAAGTFNKIIEKGCGIHPDMNIIVLTKDAAALKLSKVVGEEVIRLLNTQDEGRIKELMPKLKDDGVSVVWENIKSVISDRMFEEFGSLYRGKEDPEFIALIDAGQDAEVPDLSKFEDQSKALTKVGLFADAANATTTAATATNSHP